MARKPVTGAWLVQVGYGKGSYRTKYRFDPIKSPQALFYYRCLNTHSGHKKRLVNPDGKIVAREIT